jgi:hypothetical protein
MATQSVRVDLQRHSVLESEVSGSRARSRNSAAVMEVVEGRTEEEMSYHG